MNEQDLQKVPEGSGVPFGTEYHWYILTHQNVGKLDANIYTTSMDGLKYKLAHKRVGLKIVHFGSMRSYDDDDIMNRPIDKGSK